MLRTVFIGSRNRFDQTIIHWLSERTDVAGVVWTTSSNWRSSWRGRIGFAYWRLKRRGLLSALDEAAFLAWSHMRTHARDARSIEREILVPYRKGHGRVRWTGLAVETADVNSAETLQFARDCCPDVILAMCTNDYFSRELREIPRFGAFVWHEGFTPEYRGLYAPFWTVSALDFDRIGSTLLRMSDSYDAGEPFVQEPARDIDPFVDGPLFLGHKAVYDSLPAVERFLKELEDGIARPLDRAGRESGIYTYPGLSDLIQQRLSLRRESGTRSPR